MCCGILTSMLAFSVNTEASEETTVAEKVWTIELNLPVLNEEDNLEKIKVYNKGGQEVQVEIDVDSNNNKFLEVFADEGFESGEYSLEIPVGFESEIGLLTNESYTKHFVVEDVMTHAHLAKEWKTRYEYHGILYEIKATFNNGNVALKITDLADGLQYTGRETYELVDSNMLMYVDDLRLNLNGNIRYYNEDYFKIVTASGKYTYFETVQ